MNIPRNKFLIIVGAVIVLGTASVFALYSTNHQKQKITSPIPNSSSQPQNSQNSQSNQQTEANNGKQQNPNAQSTTLIAPTGTYASNHHVSLSASQTYRQEESTCNTMAGASCDIQFTKDGVTKSLGPKTADGSGTVYWTWDPSTLGLTGGNWQITAITTLNGQTKSAQDPLALTVEP